MHIDDLSTPALWADVDVLKTNIAEMAQRLPGHFRQAIFAFVERAQKASANSFVSSGQQRKLALLQTMVLMTNLAFNLMAYANAADALVCMISELLLTGRRLHRSTAWA